MFFMGTPGLVLTFPIPTCSGGPEHCKQAVLTEPDRNIFHGTLTIAYFICWAGQFLIHRVEYNLIPNNRWVALLRSVAHWLALWAE